MPMFKHLCYEPCVYMCIRLPPASKCSFQCPCSNERALYIKRMRMIQCACARGHMGAHPRRHLSGSNVHVDGCSCSHLCVCMLTLKYVCAHIDGCMHNSLMDACTLTLMDTCMHMHARMHAFMGLACNASESLWPSPLCLCRHALPSVPVPPCPHALGRIAESCGPHFSRRPILSKLAPPQVDLVPRPPVWQLHGPRWLPRLPQSCWRGCCFHTSALLSCTPQTTGAATTRALGPVKGRAAALERQPNALLMPRRRRNALAAFRTAPPRPPCPSGKLWNKLAPRDGGDGGRLAATQPTTAEAHTQPALSLSGSGGVTIAGTSTHGKLLPRA
eukprot:358404-Chlamydomonas_euryale.AAC.17